MLSKSPESSLKLLHLRTNSVVTLDQNEKESSDIQYLLSKGLDKKHSVFTDVEKVTAPQILKKSVDFEL